MATKAYGYLRVSGKGQVDGDGFERQRLAIERYAKLTSIEIVQFYEEKGISGTNDADDRPAWVEMMDKVIHNGVRTVVIEKLDRLARGLMVQEHIIADLKRRKVEIVSVSYTHLTLPTNREV